MDRNTTLKSVPDCEVDFCRSKNLKEEQDRNDKKHDTQDDVLFVRSR